MPPEVISDPRNPRLIMGHWRGRKQAAGEVVTWMLALLRRLAEFGPDFHNLIDSIAHEKKRSTPVPARSATPEQALAMLRGIDSRQHPTRATDTERLGYRATFHDPRQPRDQQIDVRVSGGDKPEGISGSISMVLPHLVVAFPRPMGWYQRVLQAVIEVTDPDQARVETLRYDLPERPTGRLNMTGREPNFLLRWQSDRVPYLPVGGIDDPEPPAISRPWLGGILHEWPQRRAMFGVSDVSNSTP